MNTIILKRKQRLAEVRMKKQRARNKKIVAATVAGSFTALVFMNNRVSACSTDYTVKKNDTLYSLSKKYQVGISQLIEVNDLPTEKIYVDQHLNVPEDIVVPQFKGNSSQYTVQKGDTLFSLSKNYSISVKDLQKENNLLSDQINIGQRILVPIKTPAPSGEEMYTVYPGDTLWGIAKRFDVTVKDLARENKLSQEMVLIGQRLVIPGKAKFADVEVVGAADSFTVEFMQKGKPFVLKVPYGSAPNYQDKSGQKVMVTYKNGALISAF
ncbi:LysM peptidoglycan-binding domain-containing protein [Neobacillus sp. PS3-40]|uniref:LysM peptidoglycan-binding domain-containing protein n=1 Tax=Neobacillus sp. PS3-40 TaxID=3070679 RepID=UPI0027E0A226|nr:LysM peptidoglycan-binding domain-containing protein [Neobacillus sp. PS3-40]WML45759.1 LysM peptidoglycan-binding domain-containing protein [Neobacillus sp. PS3-40]